MILCAFMIIIFSLSNLNFFFCHRRNYIHDLSKEFITKLADNVLVCCNESAEACSSGQQVLLFLLSDARCNRPQEVSRPIYRLFFVLFLA